jgi:hypothetical protein
MPELEGGAEPGFENMGPISETQPQEDTENPIHSEVSTADPEIKEPEEAPTEEVSLNEEREITAEKAPRKKPRALPKRLPRRNSPRFSLKY